jgi:uncharacterized protein YjbI with pentapeptide repeats
MLWRANLEKANFAEAKMEGAVLWKARLLGALNLTVEQLSTVKTIQGADLDARLRMEIERDCPNILEEQQR